MPRHEVLFAGLREDQILSLPDETIRELVLVGEPIVFGAGSAQIPGSFRIESDRLVVELAQIEGGGEGVLVSLGSLARRYATLRGLSSVEWIRSRGFLCATEPQAAACTGAPRVCS